MIDKMLIRGAKVHILKNMDVDIPPGKIVASGTPREIRENKNSITGRYLRV